MGTAFDMMDVMNEIDVGIVPRAIRHLFFGMESRKQRALEQGFVEPCFDIVAQFVEVLSTASFIKCKLNQNFFHVQFLYYSVVSFE